MRDVRALVAASHPGPSLAITAMASVLAAQAAPHGTGPVLVVPAMLAGQLSVGWSNDAFDAARDAAAGRTDKPVATGAVSKRAVWTAAGAALAASLAMALAISSATLLVTAVIVGAAWAYNAGLKSTLWSGVMYVAGFGPIPAFATSTLPGHPWPRWQVTLAAAAVGLGAHFANVLPDLAADKATGVKGLPQQVAARWGPGAVRACALALLLAASVLLLLTASPARRWVAAIGLAAAAVLAVVGARASGRLPFLAAILIAAIDVVLFVAAGEALS
ncbi:MAG TPA: UbiA family prenyltransferase [Trebonia sp.]|nr:UbiA family prenyltransferase [Trebonia sp.]